MAIQLIDLGASANNGLGDKLRIGGDKINDNFTEIYDKLISDNFVVIKTLSDFPAPVANVITLLNDTTYFVTAEIDTLGKSIVLGSGTAIKGTSPLNAKLYSSAGVLPLELVSSSSSVDVSNITIDSGIYNSIGFSGNETIDTILLANIVFENCFSLGAIQNYKNVSINNCDFKNSDNLNFDLTIDNLHINNCNIATTSQFITIESTAIILNQFKVSNSYLYATGTDVLIGANASANYPVNGYILENNNFDGGSTSYISGLSHSSPKAYFKNNIGIRNTSDTGHATYFDTLHTVGSPQVMIQGVTPILLTNNAGTTITSQLPSGATNLFDSATTKITPLLENDFNSVDIMFFVKNNTVNGFFTIYIDIPTLGVRFGQTVICPKAANTEMQVNYNFNHYVSSQFAANGGYIYIIPENGNLSIYDKQFRFSRLIKGQI